MAKLQAGEVCLFVLAFQIIFVLFWKDVLFNMVFGERCVTLWNGRGRVGRCIIVHNAFSMRAIENNTSCMWRAGEMERINDWATEAEWQQQGCWASCLGNLSLLGHSSLGLTLAIASEHLPAAGMTRLFEKQMNDKKLLGPQKEIRSVTQWQS